ncbi:MAG: hypothetical protein ABSF32_04110 [Ignavibacteria bacterium]|jgi:hypothetical protein
MKRILIFLLLAGLMSCSKNEKQQEKENSSKNQEGIENPSDTIMTVEEKFSTSILSDFLDDTDDEDLASYLEDELFKYSQNYRGASVMQISNSLWFVSLENQNNVKNFLLQKFVDFNTNEYYFRLSETSLNITDIILNNNLSRNSNSLKKIVTLLPKDQQNK